jgi:hypothetical protein
VHDLRSYEWHGVYVHGDGDERVGYWCGVDRVGRSDSFDGSRCAHLGVSNLEREWSVGCFVDYPLEWWSFDHWVHGDPVYLGYCADSGGVWFGESVHDHGSHEWHGVHIHRDSDERSRYWCGFDSVCCGDAVDRSRCADVRDCDVECG